MRYSWVRVLMFGVSFAGVPAGSVLAQEQPVVLVHGIISGPETWAGAAERLQTRLQIAPERPAVSWRSSIESQSEQLQSSLGGLSNSTVVVGHSLGGIVAREWSRRRAVDGVITLGSPNRGAPLANHINEWVGFNNALFGAVGNAFYRLANVPYDDWWWVVPAVEGALGWGGVVADFAIRHLLIDLGMQYSVPFVQEIPVGSPYLNNLNGGNLGREAADIPNRVGIVNTATEYWSGGPFRLKDPDNGGEYSLLTSAAAAALDYWGFRVFSEADPLDSQAHSLAYGLWDAAFWLWNFDEFWCRAISDDRPLWSGYCLPNDGFVPGWSQFYPGATLNIEVNGGPVHTRETRHFDEAIYAVLTGVMHVPPRAGESPDVPPPSEPAPEPTPSDPPVPVPVPGPELPAPAPSPEPPAPAPAPPVPPPPTVPAPPPLGGTGSLEPDRSLYAGQSITSNNGWYYLEYQGDGNLVLSRYDGLPLWASHTAGTSPGQAVMQLDGNFLIYDAFGTPLWHTATVGYDGARLVVQDDGNLVLQSAAGAPIWASGTGGM